MLTSISGVETRIAQARERHQELHRTTPVWVSPGLVNFQEWEARGAKKSKADMVFVSFQKGFEKLG